MPIVKRSPTSPGRRAVISVIDKTLHRGKPHKPLLAKKSKTGGRNNQGRITTRHIGGGERQQYRLVDFKRNKLDIPAVVERIEYDPNRSARIALLLYKDGERRYIIAPNLIKAGDEVISSASAPIKAGNCLPLSNIPVGTVTRLDG